MEYMKMSNAVIGTEFTQNKVVIITTTEYDKLDIWTSLTGSGFTGSLNSWITDIDFDTWYDPCPLTITYLDISDNIQKKVVTFHDVCLAFTELVNQNITHCGGYAINDIENADSCFADLVLQQVVFGEIVYG